jgi:cathepsin K
MADIKFGWQKDKRDERDFLQPPKVQKLPTLIDLSSFLPNVRDQGRVGSCVGFGVGSAVGSQAYWWGAFTEWYSPTWIYNGARIIEGSLTQDVGCSPRNALDYLVKTGNLLEHDWPYNSEMVDKNMPSETQYKEAIFYKNFVYFRVVDGVEGLKASLSDDHCLAIGGPWFNKWFSPVDGMLSEVSSTDDVAGGHETILYGYDDERAVFFGQNSWGLGWGRAGRYMLPYSSIQVFKQLGGYDAHYVTFESSLVPTPSPCKWGKKITDSLNWVQETRGRKGRFFYMNP